MENLQVGDKVLTGSNKYQTVYSFGHYHEIMEDQFFQIHFDNNNKPLEMTGNHMIYVVDQKGEEQTIRADQLQVGDLLLEPKKNAQRVTKITTTTKQGLCMPLTTDGTIVVDEMVASNYVSLDGEAPGTLQMAATLFSLDQQSIFHLWLSPCRMLCMGVSSRFCSQLDERDGILQWLHTGRWLVREAESHGAVTRTVVIGVPAVVVFTFLSPLECLFGGPALAPLGVAFTVALLHYWRKHKKSRKEKKRKGAVEFDTKPKSKRASYCRD